MSDSITIVTDVNFKKEVLNDAGVVMVDFYADWCGPCKMIAPIVEQLANEYAGKVKVAKLNVDQSPNASVSYKVMGVPSILFFKGGKEVFRAVGAKAKGEYSRILNNAIAGSI